MKLPWETDKPAAPDGSGVLDYRDFIKPHNGPPIPPGSNPLDWDESDLESQLVAVYGEEDYLLARTLFNKLRYEFPGKPLTSVSPVLFAKEILDACKQASDRAAEHGETYSVKYIMESPDTVALLKGHVDSPSVSTLGLVYGSRLSRLRMGRPEFLVIDKKIKNGEKPAFGDVLAHYGYKVGWRGVVLLWFVLPFIFQMLFQEFSPMVQGYFTNLAAKGFNVTALAACLILGYLCAEFGGYTKSWRQVKYALLVAAPAVFMFGAWRWLLWPK